MARNFIPDDYVDVAERIRRFYERHPEGRITTDMATWNEDGIVFVARVYRDRTQPVDMPDAVGWAHEVPGQGHVNKTSAVENCETSAIGRALANLGFPVKDGEPRPSRQEMQKVERARERARPKDDAPATDDQLRAIDRLAVERAIPARQEEAFKRRLAAGLTQAGADDAIRWLESLPMAQEPAV